MPTFHYILMHAQQHNTLVEFSVEQKLVTLGPADNGCHFCSLLLPGRCMFKYSPTTLRQFCIFTAPGAPTSTYAPPQLMTGSTLTSFLQEQKDQILAAAGGVILLKSESLAGKFQIHNSQ